MMMLMAKPTSENKTKKDQVNQQRENKWYLKIGGFTTKSMLKRGRWWLLLELSHIMGIDPRNLNLQYQSVRGYTFVSNSLAYMVRLFRVKRQPHLTGTQAPLAWVLTPPNMHAYVEALQFLCVLWKAGTDSLILLFHHHPSLPLCWSWAINGAPFLWNRG